MSHGGKRTGAGRKKGSTTIKTREIAAKHEATGAMMPLDVMLRAMSEHVAAERWDAAHEKAKDAAPYCHPKLASTEHSGPNGGPIPIKAAIRFVRPS